VAGVAAAGDGQTPNCYHGAMNMIHKTLIVAIVALTSGLAGCYERVVSDNSVDAQFSRSMQPGTVHTGTGTPRDGNTQNNANSPNAGGSNFRPNW
jgi:hypothetical protein